MAAASVKSVDGDDVLEFGESRVQFQCNPLELVVLQAASTGRNRGIPTCLQAVSKLPLWVVGRDGPVPFGKMVARTHQERDRSVGERVVAMRTTPMQGQTGIGTLTPTHKDG